MLDFILADANTPFSIAIALVLIIGLFEGLGAVLGVGLGNLLDSLIPEFDANTDFEVADAGSNTALSRLLGWLKVGKVPILMLLITFLVAFGCIGYVLNFITTGTFGLLLPKPLTVPAAFVAALPVVRVGASALQAVMPKDESSSVSLATLIGREALITIGESTSTSPAEGRVRDQHGNTHYVMILAEEGCGPFGPGMPLLLVRQKKNQFVAIAADSSTLEK